MISPLIVEEVRLKLTSGAHKTLHGGVMFSCGVVHPRKGETSWIPVSFGFMDEPTMQMASPQDLRELAELFLKMADALEAP